MGKEAKIGISVIVVLVLCLGGVVAKRIISPGKPNQASTTDQPTKEKDATTPAVKTGPQVLQSGAAGARPTVVAAKPLNGQAAKSSPLDVGHWNTAGDSAKRAAADTAAKAPPSYMPKSPQPYEVDPNDRYASNYPQRGARVGELGSAEVGSADTGMAGASDAGSEPYDPYQRRDYHQSGLASGQPASSGTLKVLSPPATSRANTTATGSATAKAGATIPNYTATRGTPGNSATADRAAADPFNGRYAAQRDPGAAESRYTASRGATGYADSDYAAPAQAGSRTTPSYSGGASGYTAARPVPSYGSGNRFNALDAAYGMVRDPRRDDGTYEIQPNDSYWTISEKCYGTGSYFKALAEVNRKKIPQEDQLKVGAVILAPDVAQLERQYPKLCPKASRREVIKRGATPISTSAHLAGARTYVSQEGDTLYEIAKAELGKASRWTEIYELNREQIGPDYDYLPAGLHLSLPGNEPADTVTRRPAPSPSLRFQR